jgi:MbtH protein
MAEDPEDSTLYKVVVNHEEQYSIWPVSRENALGWHDSGKEGLKADCLAYIKEVWTDMRPLSLRRRMEQEKGAPKTEPAENTGRDDAGSEN